MGVFDFLYKISGHAQLDEEESKFIFGDKVKITGGFYKGQTGCITRLRKATSLSPSGAWVGYWVKLDNSDETKEPIEVSDLKLL